MYIHVHVHCCLCVPYMYVACVCNMFVCLFLSFSSLLSSAYISDFSCKRMSLQFPLFFICVACVPKAVQLGTSGVPSLDSEGGGGCVLGPVLC